MEHFTHCPMPVKGGADCWRESHPASRHGLCVTHWRDIIQDWVVDTPHTTRRCPECGILNRYDTADFASVRCTKCGENMDAAWLISKRPQIEAAVATIKPKARGVVYYMGFGELVKIGFSTNLSERARAIPNDEVLAAEPGDYPLEHARHRQFAPHLVDGQREWFTAAPELLEHVRSVRAEHGDPLAVCQAVQIDHTRIAALEDFGVPYDR